MCDIYNRLKKFEYISFDLFDTLIKRQVAKPEDVFSLVELQYYRRYGKKTIEKFSTLRKQALETAQKKYHKKTCSLDEIYSCIDLDKETLAVLKKLEIETEISVNVANYPVFHLFQRLRSANKKIIIISDMYLPAHVVKQILDKNNINGYLEVFVSCDYGCSKSDGGLYQAACERLGVSPKQIFHIGDGLKNDYLQAKHRKLSAYHIPTYVKRIRYYSSRGFNSDDLFYYNTLTAISNNQLPALTSDFSKLGCEVMGPLVFGFVQWLYQKVKEEGIRSIFFLAREGKILLDAYKILIDDSSIKINYFYGSRRSLIVPTYWTKPTLKQINESMSMPKYLSVHDLLNRWALNPEEYEDKIHLSKLSEDEKILSKDMNHDSRIQKLFDLVKDDIIHNSIAEYSTLEKYLKQQNFNGKIAIVDVGWNGGMQKALEELPYVKQHGVRVYGYYLGINGKNLKTRFDHAYGYLYENETNLKNRYYIYGFAGPLELSLTAEHGTTIKYMEADGEICPQLAENEYTDSDGNATKELNCMIQMQEGIRSYLYGAGYLKDLFGVFPISSEVAFRNCLLFGTQPHRKDIMLYRNFEAYDLKAKQIFIGTKYRHLFGKYSMKQGFWLSTWKLGFMKYIFRLPLPYKEIYRYFRQREEPK